MLFGCGFAQVKRYSVRRGAGTRPAGLPLQHGRVPTAPPDPMSPPTTHRAPPDRFGRTDPSPGSARPHQPGSCFVSPGAIPALDPSGPSCHPVDRADPSPDPPSRFRPAHRFGPVRRIPPRTRLTGPHREPTPSRTSSHARRPREPLPEVRSAGQASQSVSRTGPARGASQPDESLPGSVPPRRPLSRSATSAGPVHEARQPNRSSPGLSRRANLASRSVSPTGPRARQPDRPSPTRPAAPAHRLGQPGKSSRTVPPRQSAESASRRSPPGPSRRANPPVPPDREPANGANPSGPVRPRQSAGPARTSSRNPLAGRALPEPV